MAEKPIEQPERVVAFEVIRGDGEEHVLALTNIGRMFERHRDARYFPQGPHDAKTRYLWREVPGPLDPT